MTFFQRALKLLSNQRGAMFGLDARIALFVFGGISTLSAGYAVLNLNDFYAQGFSKELRDWKTAIEAIHKDLRQDVHNSLTTESDENAVVALYDPSVLSSATLQTKWHGPYINQLGTTHPKYGDIRITKLQDDAATTCASGTLCYLWLTVSAVKSGITTHLNEIFDGTGESTPGSEGVLQWTGSGSTVTVYYRVSRALAL